MDGKCIACLTPGLCPTHGYPPDEADEHGNSLGTIYLLRFDGGYKEHEFVCATSYRKRAEKLGAIIVQLRAGIRELAHGKHSGRDFANRLLSETALDEEESPNEAWWERQKERDRWKG